MSFPTISVVTPSFNHRHYLRETIDSVLNQKYPNLEYVLVDGGSTDGSAEIIREYAPRLKYWVSEPDHGLGHALNKGFAQTTGEIMAWLNSDDKYPPWTFDVVAQIFSSFPEVNWIVGINSWWDESGRMVNVQRIYKNIYDFLSGNHEWIQQESVFWRRKLWERAGGKINEDYRLMVDGELWCRFFRTDRLYNVDTVIGGYRQHGDNRALLNGDQCAAEMGKAISWLRNNCGQAVLDNFKILQDIQAFRRNPQPGQTSLSVEKQREFTRACEGAAYDRITWHNGQWEKSKVRFPTCQ